MKEKELSESLLNWFSNLTINKNTWNKNPVGRIIKQQLKKLGKWKDKARGKPKKGYRAMQESMIRKEIEKEKEAFTDLF